MQLINDKKQSPTPTSCTWDSVSLEAHYVFLEPEENHHVAGDLWALLSPCSCLQRDYFSKSFHMVTWAVIWGPRNPRQEAWVSLHIQNRPSWLCSLEGLDIFCWIILGKSFNHCVLISLLKKWFPQGCDKSKTDKIWENTVNNVCVIATPMNRGINYKGT